MLLTSLLQCCSDESSLRISHRRLEFLIAFLFLQEFECDVSVAEGDRRQEFSFTLYDFDGHGKITKDDIAGLVTTIYDTLGASIQVPPCGSKTIKVKLTVSPDQRTSSNSSQQQSRNAAGSCSNATQAPQVATATFGHHTSSQSCCHQKQEADLCSHTSHTAQYGTNRVPRRRRAPRYRCQVRFDTDISSFAYVHAS